MHYIIISLVAITGGAFFVFRKSLRGKKNEGFSIDFDDMKFSETKSNCSI
jgi:hypothetical protein